ncbi:MAG TPA: DUF192 domain-containing protein [Anaerolineales bacterium]|nr:DUF192 domain-containing protein [Anaerolineales bacterium]
MTRWVNVVNESRGGLPVVRARWCASFLCRLRGLSFRSSLGKGEGLLLVERRASRVDASIHMLGMFFPLGVVWIDGDHRVVDTRLAQPWRVYAPRSAAQFTLEASPQILDFLSPGEQVDFIDEAVV